MWNRNQPPHGSKLQWVQTFCRVLHCITLEVRFSFEETKSSKGYDIRVCCRCYTKISGHFVYLVGPTRRASSFDYILKTISCEYDRWVVETRLCKLRDTTIYERPTSRHGSPIDQLLHNGSNMYFLVWRVCCALVLGHVSIQLAYFDLLAMTYVKKRTLFTDVIAHRPRLFYWLLCLTIACGHIFCICLGSRTIGHGVYFW